MMSCKRSLKPASGLPCLMLNECAECARLRQVYWAAIAECARLDEVWRQAMLCDPDKCHDLNAECEGADRARVAARDALHRHKASGHA
jgi:hypothetical protein